MTPERAKEIRAYWDALDDGDISTEQLFARVSEHFGIDDGDVSNALWLSRTPQEKEVDK